MRTILGEVYNRKPRWHPLINEDGTYTVLIVTSANEETQSFKLDFWTRQFTMNDGKYGRGLVDAQGRKASATDPSYVFTFATRVMPGLDIQAVVDGFVGGLNREVKLPQNDVWNFVASYPQGDLCRSDS
jgi:hypothetical protein